MIQTNPEERAAIAQGHIPTLKTVLEREHKKLLVRLLNEKKEFQFAQGEAYYSQELCDLLGIKQ